MPVTAIPSASVSTPTPTPTPSPSSSNLARTGLRVGIVQAGRVLEERVLETARRVTIGTSAASTFIVPTEGLPPRWRLFDRRSGRWALHLGAGMSARIATGAEVVSIRGGEPSSSPKSVPLGDGARGKVTLGDITVLFQLVRPPSRGPRPQLPISVRRSLLAEMDVLFTAVLAAVLALHLVVVIYLRSVDWPRRPPIEELPDRFVRQLPHRPRPQPAHPEPVAGEPTVSHGRPRTSPPPARPAGVRDRTPATPPAGAADRHAEIAAKVRNMGLMPLLTAPGEASSSPLADLLAAGAVDRSLDEALRGVSTVQIAGDASLAHLPLVRGVTGRVGVVDRPLGVGPIAAPADTGAVGERPARAALRVGPPVVEGGHVDPQAIAREIRDRRKAIAACYERALKQQPTLAGKLVVRFTIAPAGPVVSVEVDEDTLGAPAVAACVRAVILRWRFTTVGEEPVEVSFPFVFQAGD